MSHENIIRTFVARDDKVLVGVPSWVRQPRDGELVATWQFNAGGVLAPDFEIRAVAYPNKDRALQPYFKLGLHYLSSPVCRLDFQTDKSHPNHIKNRPVHVPAGTVYGCHWHDFEDNRYLFAAAKMPTKFLFATPAPDRVTRFDQAFHWFCDKINTVHVNGNLIDLPGRTSLL